MASALVWTTCLLICGKWNSFVQFICSSIGWVWTDSHLSDKAIKIAFGTIGLPFELWVRTLNWGGGGSIWKSFQFRFNFCVKTFLCVSLELAWCLDSDFVPKMSTCFRHLVVGLVHVPLQRYRQGECCAGFSCQFWPHVLLRPRNLQTVFWVHF